MHAAYVLLNEMELEALSRQVKEWLSNSQFSMFEGERENAECLLHKLEIASQSVHEIPEDVIPF